MLNREMEIQRRENLLRQISDVEKDLLSVFVEGDYIIARQNDTGEMRVVRSMGGGIRK